MNTSTAHDAPARETAPPPALRSGIAHLVFWGVAGAALALDLWSKHWAFSEMGPDELRPIIDGWIDFRRSLNAGAVFGSFAGRTQLFILASVFAVGFVLYLFATSRRGQYSLHVALAMILAGAVGNLYDRTFIKADVVIYETDSGRPKMFIGRVVSEPGAETVLVGNWPGGSHPRAFEPEEIDVRRQGVVRDFIKLIPEFPAWVPAVGGRDVWPWVFNVADMALVGGVLVLLLGSIPLGGRGSDA